MALKSKEEFLLLDKSKLRKLTKKDISIALPDLKNIFESKATVISEWMINWIETDLSLGNIKPTDLLPQKAELAYLLGVSVGTIQNALRYVEDKGYVESKQRIGTMVRDLKTPSATVRKLTSKRDVCIDLIKKYIVDSGVKIGQKIPSSRVLAGVIGASPNTTRLALEKLCSLDILECSFKSPKESCLVLKTDKFSMPKVNATISDNVTLVDKVKSDLEKYITTNLKVGDKLPAHEMLSNELKVSIKTIHDSLKGLINEGVLLPRRGRYGTTVIKLPGKNSNFSKKEDMIFAPAHEAAFYNYEKTQDHIKAMIGDKFPIGSKLPSILTLSKELDLSPNTIRKALNNLAEEGYLRFVRGRYGGTFVIDIPDTAAQGFKWLAVNPKYVEAYK